MTTIRRPLKKMQALSHQKRKLKRSLKAMQMFLKVPITVKTTTRKEIMTNKRLIFHSRKIRMSLEEFLHQEDPSQPGIKIFFSVIAFLAKILVIRK
jgi:hypothetical protein